MERLAPQHRGVAEERLAHLLEARTGYRGGAAALARAREPRRAYDPAREPRLVDRLDAKASEFPTPRRTLQRWWAAYEQRGLPGLVDVRVSAPRKVLPSVDPRVKEEALALVKGWADKATPTQRQLAIHLKVAVTDR